MDEFSWAVGLFEGEGSISFCRRSNGHYYPRISIAMTDEDVIDRFERAFPGGGRYGWWIKETKRMHQYAIQGRDAIEAFLLAVQPHLSVKKSDECERALELIAESRIRKPASPTFRRKPGTLTAEDIAAMRQERAMGAKVADLSEKYLIGKSHVSRLTKGAA